MRIWSVVVLLAGCGSSGSGGVTPQIDGSVAAAGDGGTPTDLSRNVQYIRKAPFPRLVIEVDAVPGFAPRPASQSSLAQGLGQILDKPGGVTATTDKALVSKGVDHVWTFGELDGLATASFDLPVGDDTIKMHVMFVDGHYEQDSSSFKILGLAWNLTHLVIFKKNLEDSCGSVLPLLREQVCAAAELAVWTHETGHLLGLVDNGLAMVQNHRDPDQSHGPHDASDQCVMYYAYEGQDLIGVLATRIGGGNNANLGFDQACLNDINAAK